MQLITRCFLFVIFFLSIIGVQAQKYNTAAGVRIGTEFGITVQQRIAERWTLEGIVQKGFFNNTTTITLLGENHNKILFRGFNFYYGAGPHVGLYQNNKTDERYAVYGVTGLGGIEAKFGNILVSYDYKPAINLGRAEKVFDSQTALSVRFILAKKPRNDEWMFWKKWKKEK